MSQVDETVERREEAADVELRPSTPPVSRLVGLALTALSILWLFASSGFDAQGLGVAITVLATAGIYALATLGLNVHFGYTGLINIGHVAFMAVGAYTTVLLLPHELGRVGTASDGVLPLIPAVIVGMAAAAFLGLLLGIPTLRLRGDYLAITTIAVGEIVRLVARNSTELTGGVFGVVGFSDALQDLRPGFVDSIAASYDGAPAQLWVFIVSWLMVGLTVLFLRGLLASPFGRVLRAIREDEDAANALGKNVFWYKLQSLMIGGAIGGLAGALLAFSFAQVNPDTFLPLLTFYMWTIMIVGGAGSLAGPVAGSVIFWVLLTQTDNFAQDVFGDAVTGPLQAALRFIITGLLIMVFIVFRPQGLFGKKEELLLDFK